MTIRRQWLLVLTVTAVLAVWINSLILGSLINRYFLSYNTESYNNHVEQIEQLALSALDEGGLSGRQLSLQFESHLDDPILSIRLYDPAGRLIAVSENTDGGMMGGMMSDRMRRPIQSAEEIDTFEVADDTGRVLGVLHITRYSALRDSLVSVMFRSALVRNSVVSFAVVLVILLIIGVFVSRKLSRDLRNTAALAQSVDMGGRPDYKPARVREIRIIQDGLETLQNRLKIKQIGRKRMVDGLVHQTRTPLTILKAHLEGLEDGVIEMSPDEIKVCQAQIDNITAILSNMSTLLDADRPAQTGSTEPVELHAMLRQILAGLQVQFKNKGIDLRLSSTRKIALRTDRYKLSQCIYNLLTNAYKFTPIGGRVELSYDNTPAGIEIRIKDNGAGIDPDDLRHLFDAYFRGRNADASAGDGLGLYIARENVQQLGGAINVRSQPGAGSEFIVTIPYNAD